MSTNLNIDYFNLKDIKKNLIKKNKIFIVKKFLLSFKQPVQIEPLLIKGLIGPIPERWRRWDVTQPSAISPLCNLTK